MSTDRAHDNAGPHPSAAGLRTIAQDVVTHARHRAKHEITEPVGEKLAVIASGIADTSVPVSGADRVRRSMGPLLACTSGAVVVFALLRRRGRRRRR